MKNKSNFFLAKENIRIVSACLAGIRCRYDGGSCPSDKVIDLVVEGKAIPLCPEQLGGLPTPRTPAERAGSRVVTKEGKDVTREFQRGAQEALKIAKMVGCREAILKSKSPSCGAGRIYDGTFSGGLIDDDGVFASLLKKHGVKVLTEREI